MKCSAFVTLVLAVGICVVSAQSEPACDASTGLTQEQCIDYTNEGAIYVTFVDKQSDLTASEIDHFKVVMANITDDYVILPILPEHIVIVQEGINSVTSERMLRFFIVNPSGSEYMPVALRRQELYLMINLNNDLVNERLRMDIVAQEPPSPYTLALPAWAIAILAYVGVVVVIYCIMVITRDWRNKMTSEFEAELEKAYYEKEGVKGGEEANGDIALKKISPSSNDYEVVNEKKTSEIGVQTPRHVAIQYDPNDFADASAPTPTTEAVIENGDTTSDNDPRYANVRLPSAASDSAKQADAKGIDSGNADIAAAKEADDAAAAIEGAVNEGFSGDEAGTQPSTHL